VLRIAGLFASRDPGAGVVPASWIAEMSRPSRVHPETTLQLARSTLDGMEVLGSSDDDGSSFWVVRDRGLAIVNIAGPGGGVIPELPAQVLAALRVDRPKAD
jgi:hypothetical protein